MLIGIDASRAFLRRRTGIEEYAYQTIKHLRAVISESDSVVLYVRKKIVFGNEQNEPEQSFASAQVASTDFRYCLVRCIRKRVHIRLVYPNIDFDLPKNWTVKGLWAPRFWTQIRLSLEMFFHRPDVLFVPAHTVPIIHPKKTIVTIHGLEYEFCPRAYALWERLYMRLSIRFSCRAAETVVCVSENTKRDVTRLYGTTEKKIRVVYEGYDSNFQFPISNFQSNKKSQFPTPKPYLLFIGRLEERKNIVRIIKAFEILKETYHIPHTLLLVGKPGYGYQSIRQQVAGSTHTDDIRELGYVTESEKWELLERADVFLFPTLYEGFGIPVLEAQSVGVPVVTSDVSSLPEVGGKGAVYCDPYGTESIADGVWNILSNGEMRDDIIEKGRENARRFSWAKCASDIGDEIMRKQ